MTIRRISVQFPLMLLAFIVVMCQSAPAQVSNRPADPVTADPLQVDTAFPPGAAELGFESKGSRLNSLLYLAGGKGPHPTVILLHGFPGYERNGDLAQAFRRAGMNTLVLSYRGAWGTSGTFSFSHALEDVASAIAFVRADSNVAAFGIDPGRVILVGHSMGGWLALMGGGAAGSSVACTVALDFWNVGMDGRRMRSGAERDSALTAYMAWVTEPGGPLRVANGVQGLIDEMKEHSDDWDVERKATALMGHPSLLIAAVNIQAQSRLVAALEAAHATRVTAFSWKTDHGFSDRRIQLARTIVDWVHRQCGR